MNATEEFLAVINRLAENFRQMNRPDDRTGPYHELTNQVLSKAVWAVKLHLDPDTASELMEAYSDYVHFPVEGFEGPAPDGINRPYLEDLLVHLLEHMSTIATGGTRVVT